MIKLLIIPVVLLFVAIVVAIAERLPGELGEMIDVDADNPFDDNVQLFK